jgi:hypothetical protein
MRQRAQPDQGWQAPGAGAFEGAIESAPGPAVGGRKVRVNGNVLVASLLRTELPDAGLSMPSSFTVPLTAIPKRFRLTLRVRGVRAGARGRVSP